MFKRMDTKLIVENWRKFISESEENQSSTSIDEYIKLGLLEEYDSFLELAPFRRFIRRVKSKNIMSDAKSLIEDIMSNKIKVDDMSNFHKFRDFVGVEEVKAKEIKNYFYDEEFENFINSKKNVIENTIEVINTEFVNQNPRSMLDFKEKSIIPKLKELIDTLLSDFKQKYINNPEVKMKRMPQYLDDKFFDDCLDVFSYIAKNSQEIHADLAYSFEGVRSVDLN